MVYSIDPGFNSSGFCSLDLEARVVQLWSSKKDKIKIIGLPMPDLFKMSVDRTKFYIDQLNIKNPENTEIIIEYTSLGLQFSTSLNVLIGVFVSTLLSNNLIARMTYVPPKTSHWLIQKRKASYTEIKTQVLSLFPAQDWVKKGYKLNAHTIDSLLFASFCHTDFFREIGIPLEEPKNKKQKKGFLYVN